MLFFNSQNRHGLSHRTRRISPMVEFKNKEDTEEALFAKVSMMEIVLFFY